MNRITEKHELLRETMPSDRAGPGFGITRDGRSYAYSAIQQLSELQLVEGLK